MPWLSWLITSLSPWRPGFNPLPVRVEFVVDRMAVGQVPPPSTPICMLAVLFHLQHSILIHTFECYITIAVDITLSNALKKYTPCILKHNMPSVCESETC